MLVGILKAKTQKRIFYSPKQRLTGIIEKNTKKKKKGINRKGDKEQKGQKEN